MRPWMIRQLERERRKLDRQRRKSGEERVALNAPIPRAELPGKPGLAANEEPQLASVLRGVWITDI